MRVLNAARTISSVALFVFFLTSPALAKDLMKKGEGMDVQLFRPAVDTKGHFTVDSTPVLPHLSFSLGMMIDFGFNHWIAVEQDNPLYDRTIMERSIHTVFMANLGLAHMFVVGAQVPIGFASGYGYDGVDEFYPDEYNRDEWSTKGAFGDLALHAKAGFLRADRHPVGLGLVVQYRIGSGKSEILLGEPGNAGAFAAKAIIDSNLGPRYRIALNAGLNYPLSATKENHISDAFNASEENLFLYGPLLNAGLGQSITLVARRLDLVIEAYGNQLISEFGNMAYMSVELNAGFKLYIDGHSYLLAGAAGGLPISGTESNYGLQSALWRMFLGFAFEPSVGDRDKDGIPDDRDRCPDTPEDYDRFEDSDGCPEPDNDQDGILDVEDECPMIPEDPDGNEDHDGCPEKEEEAPSDRDGDGIPDEVDECPDDPEDKDGFKDVDGCPDPDNDKDGFPDTQDECPLEQEILNGFEDEDGCPDQGEALVKVTADKLVLLEGIQFKTASDEIIGEKSFEILNAVKSVLKANPRLRVLVEGHTDSRGKHKMNMDLSNRRAASVKKYLIEQGIDPNRMESKGFGPDKPIATNETEEGRAANRRVVFTKLEE